MFSFCANVSELFMFSLHFIAHISAVFPRMGYFSVNFSVNSVTSGTRNSTMICSIFFESSWYLSRINGGSEEIRCEQVFLWRRLHFRGQWICLWVFYESVALGRVFLIQFDGNWHYWEIFVQFFFCYESLELLWYFYSHFVVRSSLRLRRNNIRDTEVIDSRGFAG